MDFEQARQKQLANQAQEGGGTAMGAPRAQRERADELNRHMEQLHQQIERLNQELGTLNQAFDSYWSLRRKQKRSLLDPFEFLRRLVDQGLRSLERTVSWLVSRVMG